MRRVWLTLAGLAVTLAAASTAHAAAWLTPPQPISAAGADATSPLDVAVDPGSDVFMAWELDPVVQVGVRPAGGSFEVASLYGCPSGFFCTSAGAPDIAADADGASIVVFTLDGRLKAFARPAGGSFTELPEITSAPNVRLPQAAFAPDGTAIVAWQQNNVGLFAAERPPGGSFGAPIPIFTESGGEAVPLGAFELTTGGTAHAMVAFATNMSSGSGNTVRVKSVFRAPAGWGTAQPVLEESASSEPDCARSIGVTKPAVALDGGANAVAAVQVQRTESGTGVTCLSSVRTKVVAGRRPVALGTWAPLATFDDIFGVSNSSPAVASTSTGEALVAWASFVSDHWRVRNAVGPAGTSTFGAAADVPGTATAAGEELFDTRLVPQMGGEAMLAFIRGMGTDWSVEYAQRPAGGSFGNASPATAIAQVPSVMELGSSPAGDVVATWLQDDEAGNARVRSLIYDASPPVFTDVTVPGNGEVGGQLAMNASATDAFSPVTFGWTFGDGASAAGAATTHAYGATGPFDVTVTAADAAGNSSAATRTTEIAVDPNPEFLGDILLSNARMRAAARGASAIPSRRRRRRAPIGTRVTFRLSEAASVRFTVERARPGRRVRGRCVKPTRRNRKRRKCTRYLRQRGSFTVAAGAGETRFRFTGRLRDRKLRPGRYRLVAVATDADGKRSAPERARFTIVR